ncbi:uncharacterized protein LOC110689931 [Chenopodium quinoa]|uniref:uncharacterized protein LOC110689931 n=1 Tax=Chenopodium quinoa TaxID=63459 RepID=UPI000B791ED6|nr:uncharacterized protein LOC110689931 [Chenopodium quinoa]
MASYSHIFLATIVVIAFLGIVSAVDISVHVPLVTRENTDVIRVRGTIFCVKGNEWNKWIPLKGQIADVYCPLFETTSTTTDENGFFIVELPANRFDNDCRVYLDTFGHGEEDCIYRTNVNEGISGAPIVKSDENGIYQVGPFVYRTTPAEV